MLARTYTATIRGLKPVKIEVEVDSNRGTPNLILIGLPTKAVEESKERITSALINCGIRIRSRRTIVNLAPADIRKSSPTFELAIAVGLLKMYGELEFETDDTLFFGELSLDGELKPIRGALPLVLAAKEMGFSQVILPQKNAAEVSIISGIKIYPISHLKQLIELEAGGVELPQLQPQPFSAQSISTDSPLLEEIVEQTQAKRALEIAAAGGHNLFLIGPPGSGKSMLAKAMTTILPPLTEEESVEVTTIYSITGQNSGKLITTRPFRAPHHTTSYAGMVGGGHALRPGEISLAHRGILFLDEFAEFDQYVLETLRQPLEDRIIRIVRANGSVVYPTAFTLVAAANPCPCGWLGAVLQSCRCSEFAIENYQRKFSGPILDRVDLFVRVSPVDLKKIIQPIQGQESSQALKRVVAARKKQAEDWQKIGKLTNSELNTKQVKQLISLSTPAQSLLLNASQKMGLTARGYFRLIRVAQTIAHLDGKNRVLKNHLAEALQYRSSLIFN